MNTKTELFKIVVQHRLCDHLRKSGVHNLTQRDFNRETVRVANKWLLETKLNRSLWTRIYKTRVFIYNIETRRAVVELGIVTRPTNQTDGNDEVLRNSFELYLMGGIYNKRVRDDLFDYTHPK